MNPQTIQRADEVKKKDLLAMKPINRTTFARFYKVKTKYVCPNRYAWCLMATDTFAILAKGHARTIAQAQADGAEAKARLIGGTILPSSFENISG